MMACPYCGNILSGTAASCVMCGSGQTKVLVSSDPLAVSLGHQLTATQAQVAALQAEVERLREALEYVAEWRFNIAGDCVADAQALARKVLAGGDDGTHV